MIDIFGQILNWTSNNKPFALATVIKTWGSSPRPIGSAMAVSQDLEMIGSVSGGCVEGAVLKEAAQILKSGQPKRLHYGVSDEDAWSVGLSCGGKIQVFLEPFLAFSTDDKEQEIWGVLEQRIRSNEGSVLLSELSDEASNHVLVLPDGQMVGKNQEASLLKEGMRVYKERKNQVVELGDRMFFAQVYPPKSQMFIIGAAHITVDLVHFAQQFGFETIVIDPRGVFAGKTQFISQPEHLIEDWPAEVLPNYQFDPYSYAVILSHDPKIDDQALHLLLRSDVAYIGALGSKRTHAKRVARLEKAGYSAEEIARIHAPIGLGIHAKTPREIALSIIAEIIQTKNQHL